jgi:hypothetical protein
MSDRAQVNQVFDVADLKGKIILVDFNDLSLKGLLLACEPDIHIFPLVGVD